jgi:general transcription factor 3C polypeptide 3 (transcription factor C subunit 4)
LQIEQLHAGQGPMAQFVSPQDIFQPPPTILAGPDFEQSQAPFTGESYQEPLGNTFLTGGRVVHEGFIPAPGREDVDALFPDLVEPFGNEPDSADEGDSEFERRLAETANRDDSEKDKDYSTEEEVEVDPDEILIEEEFVDEEDEPVPKRGKLKTRGTRGGARRGRPSVRGRGTFQGRGDPGGNTTQRKRKPGKRGRPKGKFGPRPAADPGPQFKELQRLANDAYAREDYQEAATYALQAIALNPEIYTAHSLLSTIYSTMGRDDQSVQALIVGANTKRDAETWWQALDRIDQINEVEYPQFTKKYKQTLKLGCLNSLIELDGNDYEARSRKLDLDADRGPGRITACVRQCLKLLALRPHQYDILHRMATLGTTTPKARKLHLARIIRSFDETIDYFLAHEKPPTTPSDIDRYWSLLNVYLDLLDHACEWDRALLRLRTLSRWVQGRQRETYWDNYDDDREFDVEDVPRRTIVPEFVRKSSKANYGKAFPMEMRVKLGIYRLRKTSPDDGEAMVSATPAMLDNF